MTSPGRVEAAEELLKRRAARKSLLDFASYTHPSWQTGQHHRKICEALERVERGEVKRQMIFAPPRHGKSEIASKRFPAWYMGRHPDHQIIACSYNDELATDFGRSVRNLVADQLYRNVFPGVALSVDSTAAGRWQSNHGGVYVATGIGGPITGRGATLAIIDDPLKNREEADSARVRDSIWKWYTSTFYSRLMPGGAIVMMLCMTGDTPVLMEDATEKPLRDIRPGDRVATYDDGIITASIVRNCSSQGVDSVHTIKMKSGIVVRANARHPFLVWEEGRTKWVRTDSLKKGSIILRATGESGAASHAQNMDVTSQPKPKVCAVRITENLGGRLVSALLRLILNLGAKRVCAAITGLVSRNTNDSSTSTGGFAPYARSHQQNGILEPTGTESSASITATKLEKSEVCSATTAISRSATGRPQRYCLPPLSTFVVTHDEVDSVCESGTEEVFDVQIDRTENFIANGLVSHNTRWHESDLAARALESEKWEVLELQAITNEDTPQESALWPDWYDLEKLKHIRSVLPARDWTALYQQQPRREQGTYIQRAWFEQRWEKEAA